MIMKYTIYDLESGGIKSHLDVPEKAIEFQVGDGEGWIDGQWDFETYYVEDGILQLRSAFTLLADKKILEANGVDAIIFSVPLNCFLSINNDVVASSTGTYSFKTTVHGAYVISLVGKYTSEQIVVRAGENLEAIKADKSREINKLYSSALSGGLMATIDGSEYIFDSDENSLNLISGTASRAARAGLPDGFVWKTQDNQLIPFDLVAIQALEDAVFDHVNSTFSKKVILKATLEDLTASGEIEDFNITEIWNE